MSAAHLLIAAAGGLPEAGEAALQPRASYTPSPERSSCSEASPARRPSQDAPATVWASAEEQRRMSGQQEPPLRSQGSAGHGESARRSSASQVQSGSEDEGEGGLRLEDLLSGGSSECFASPSAAPPLWALLQFGYSRVSLKILEAFQYQVLAWRCVWARQHTVTRLFNLWKVWNPQKGCMHLRVQSTVLRVTFVLRLQLSTWKMTRMRRCQAHWRGHRRPVAGEPGLDPPLPRRGYPWPASRPPPTRPPSSAPRPACHLSGVF